MPSENGPDKTDRELLAEYAKTGSETAFSKIITRHGNMVYNTCRRHLGDSHKAEDATQAVFMLLVEKARKISRNTILSGWLFKTARFTCVTMTRQIATAAKHERKAEQMRHHEIVIGTPSWEQVRPYINKALESLSHAQRNVLVLRYLEQRSEQDVCRELKWSRSKVSVTLTRAMAGLRKRLRQQGVSVSAVALGSFLSTNAVEAAPITLIASMQSVCIGNTTASTAAGISDVVIKTLAMAKIKLISTILATSVLAGVGATAVFNRMAPRKTQPAAAPVEAKMAATSSVGSKQVILNTKSFWQCFVVRGSELVRKKSGQLQPLYELAPTSKARVKRKSMMQLNEVTKPRRTPPPSPGWTGNDFDHSDWVRQQGPIYSEAYVPVTTLCLRGTFTVKTPSDLALSLAFQGGAVIHVNGKELKRAYLPEGQLKINTPAEDYPVEAFLNPEGLLLSKKSGDPKKYADRFKARTRRLENVTIPAAMLRKGTNVLAIELHRSPASEAMFTGKTHRNIDPRRYCWWSRLAFEKLKLSAYEGKASAVAPSSARGALGVRVQNLLCRVTVDDSGDPAGETGPVRITGVRNGTFSGQLVISSRTPIDGLKVSATNLAGPGTIPASDIRIRFAIPDGAGRGHHADGFDSLEPEAPASIKPAKKGNATIQPVLISVKVPANTRPGDYSGKLTISAAGGTAQDVPLRLKVIDWQLPDARDFITHVGLVQSPDSVAMRYEVEMWSDKHWLLLEESFRLLGELGTDVVYIPMLSRTHFGNEHSMVRWVRRAGGKLKPDFSIADKYLALAVKYLGKVPVVVLYCWEPLHMPGNNPHDPGAGERPILISVVNSATGQVEETKGPTWGTPECRAFWKDAFLGMKAVLKKHGMEKSMMPGIFADFPPSKETAEDLAAAAPEAKWVVQSHQITPTIQGHLVGCATTPRRGISGLEDPTLEGHRAYGWRDCPFIFAKCPRGDLQPSSLASYYTYPEMWMASMGRRGKGTTGFGRIGADFWPVLKNKRGQVISSVIDRFAMDSAWGTLKLGYQAPTAILAAGRKGPVATIRSEMIRGGIQEAEARVFIEKILTDKTLSTKLDKDLAEHCQTMLDARVQNMIRAGGRMEYHDTPDWFWFASSGWQERSRELYSAAAELAAKAGKK